MFSSSTISQIMILCLLAILVDFSAGYKCYDGFVKITDMETNSMYNEKQCVWPQIFCVHIECDGPLLGYAKKGCISAREIREDGCRCSADNGNSSACFLCGSDLCNSVLAAGRFKCKIENDQLKIQMEELNKENAMLKSQLNAGQNDGPDQSPSVVA